MHNLTSMEAVEEIWQLPRVVVFKHSTQCVRSAQALWALKAFQTEHTELLLYVLRIQQAQRLSNYVAERSGVAHASPQILVFREGVVTAVASESTITPDWLNRHLRE